MKFPLLMRLRKQWLGLALILLAGCNYFSTPDNPAVSSPPASSSPGVPPTLEAMATEDNLPTEAIQGSPVAPPALEKVATATPVPTATPLPPPPPEETVVTFLKAWEQEDYPGMYALLSSRSQARFSLEAFIKHQRNLVETATARSLETQLLSVLQDDLTAQAAYRITLQTNIGGDFVRETSLRLQFDEGRWQVGWADEMFLPELAGGNTLVMDYQIPARAPIYDRHGLALAEQRGAVAIGVVPAEVTEEAELLEALAELLDLQPEKLKQRYAGQPPHWYIPVGEISTELWERQAARFAGLSGWRVRPIELRFYPAGAAPQLVGYIAPIFAEEWADYRIRGYRGDEKVGRAGLEEWGEAYLAGRPGGKLSIVTPGGQISATLAEKPSQPGQALYTTLDRDLQLAAQAALGSFKGAIVALNPHTGELLALVSSPAYDPNLFQPTHLNLELLNQALKDPAQPFFNRATRGQYPPGSVFKIVTMAAALESGRYTPDTIYYCGSEWDELGPGNVKKDWTVAFGLPAQGDISLLRALTVSCNPYFYHLGLDLYHFEPDFIPEMARAFGLGQATGLEGVAEASGLIPDSAWKQANLGQRWSAGDNVNMAIGQGFVLVTPLQMATMIAAVRNGGTLYRPQLIQALPALDPEPAVEFEPEALGQLPLSPEALAVLQNGLQAVTTQPGGTAQARFLGLSIPVAGKTGTAQAPGHPDGLPHSWFVGYSLANDPAKPDLALAVLVENIGDGSAYAAPIFRRVIESYFFGQPTTPYPWESGMELIATPLLTSTQVVSPAGPGLPTSPP